MTKEEERVIIHGGTEMAFVGEFIDKKEVGDYLCKRCDSVLFSSTAKFDSGTGWPSFEAAIENSVKYIKEGGRIEVRCVNCDAHLGHVFYNESMTGKNARY